MEVLARFFKNRLPNFLIAIDPPYPSQSSTMDFKTLATVVELLQEDTTEAQENQKGKQVEGKPSDAELALQLYQAELDACQTILQDHRMAQSMSQAVQEDAQVIATIAQEEDRAGNDRRMALQLGGKGQQEPGARVRDGDELDEKTLDKLSRLYVNGGNDDEASIPTEVQNEEYDREGLQAEGSKYSTNRDAVETARVDCSVCTESKVYFDIVKISCEHYYCRDCVRRLFEDSFTDESLFPPKCCKQPISLSLVEGYLGREMVKRFQEKMVEFNDANRTYCSNPDCAQYLFPETIDRDIATCGICQQSTCVLCKKPAHQGKCVEEQHEQAFLNVIEAEGWQHCFKCRSVIQLGIGCNHITCRCKAEFCYECGTEWRNCLCRVWDEERLLERGRQILARDQRPGDRPPAPAALNRVVREIRERHECNHPGRWRRIDGPHRCEECSGRLRDFILQCRHCLLRACIRCRLNRV
ncbi:hypothetical protein AJ79_03756 [Helicocarpus griseus UAMH5409]|uniref:RBR-type E3 ubiquitin transferase n=1 Tax=Helicocarpus griseus UAMH5409 TaxID=1447875 RepID=A0A2B7XWL8_9EURO|nr:hypothetical protein AJ79_03756 [Helicocarpus griseus UAMH5409]